ncbi:flagellar filament capping protein FliD [Bacillus mexicanus]|uniref:flagellar filament capping protein FliD n=1 Tax=Bacillus mexicanus TaxID=2834415 RepID=UPI003D211E9C
MASSFDNAQITAYGDRMQIFGLGSEWDTKTILEAELNILKMRQKPYVTKKDDYKSEQQTWTAFQNSLTNFNSIVSELKNLNSDSKTVSLSEEGYFTATATGSAMDATYDLSVQQVATKHRVMGDQIAEGELGIEETVKLNGKDLKITGDMDVESVAKSINDGSYGVNAVVLDNRLVLTAQKTGTTNAITFSGAAWDTLGVTTNGTIKNELQAAQGSKYAINGIEMTSDSNTVSEIDGLTINLSKVTTENVTINVSRSADNVVDKVNDLVTNYNKVIQNINTLAGEKGVLQGESIPRNLKRQMNNMLTDVKESGTMLYQLGIELDKDAKNGTIVFNESKLRKQYEDDPQKVQNILTGDNGFGGKLFKLVDNYAKSNGMIQTEIDGLDERIKRIDETLDRYDQDFERQKQSLILKYATFETQMSSLNLQNQYLTAQLGLKTNSDS